MTEQEWLTSDDPTAMLEFLRTCERLPGPLPPSDHKMRLFACGCARSFYPDLLADPDKHAGFISAIEQAETAAELGEPPSAPGEWIVNEWDATSAARWTVDDLRERRGYDPHKVAAVVRCIFGNPFRPLPAFRTVVTNPAHMSAAALDSGATEEVTWVHPCLQWNRECIPQLAQDIYDGRAWDQLPILADALEDAGLPAEEECPECEGLRKSSCPKCLGEGCSSYGIAANGPCTAGQPCARCAETGCIMNPLLAHLRSPGPHTRGCHVLDLILGK